MMMLEFQPWPKIARLNRDMVITEKIDGTNGAIVVVEGTHEDLPIAAISGKIYSVATQSRNRFINKGQDNHGFARWVSDNAQSLATDLGPGIHFGEWWGSGIQRGYGLPAGEKRFSLFNVKRWAEAEFDTGGLRVVPVIYQGPFSTGQIKVQVDQLEAFGSLAAPGFMDPEGVVVRHSASGTMFKVTVKNDEAPKTITNVKLLNWAPGLGPQFEVMELCRLLQRAPGGQGSTRSSPTSGSLCGLPAFTGGETQRSR